MNIPEEHIALFDDYLSNQMTVEDKSAFQKRLDSDPEFKNELEEYKFFTKTLELSLEKEVLLSIREGEKKFQRIKILKGLAVFALILSLALAGIQWLTNKAEEKPIRDPKSTTLMVDTLSKNTNEAVKKDASIGINPDSIQTKQIASKEVNSSPQTTPLPQEKDVLVPNVNFAKVNAFSIQKTGDLTTIYSPKRIRQIVSFRKNNESYISVDGALYRVTKQGYTKESNNRLVEGISRSSGKGKEQIFRVVYFKSDTLNKTLLTPSNKKNLRNDTLFTFKNKALVPASIPEFSTSDLYRTTEKFFTVEDIMSLEGNN